MKDMYRVYDIASRIKGFWRTEINDEKTSRVSSDIQTRNGAWFPSSSFYELLLSQRSAILKSINLSKEVVS